LPGDKVQVVVGDLTGEADLASFVAGLDVLYHCAAEIKDESRMEAVHLHGTHRLIGAARGNIGRWVQLSSTGAYGTRREGFVTEATPLAPTNTYERTKAQSDGLVAAASASGAFAHTILRPSNVFGSDMTNRSLFALIEMVRRGVFFYIGPVGASANYIHVSNVVDALQLCASSPRAVGRIYNVSDHAALEDFIGMISRALGRRSPPTTRLPEAPVRAVARALPFLPLTSSRVDALTSRVVYSNGRIETELGYRHSLAMPAAVTELVDGWLRKRGSR
jgi:nucleoside-diphosphate-sugar epimerase